MPLPSGSWVGTIVVPHTLSFSITGNLQFADDGTITGSFEARAHDSKYGDAWTGPTSGEIANGSYTEDDIHFEIRQGRATATFEGTWDSDGDDGLITGDMTSSNFVGQASIALLYVGIIEPPSTFHVLVW